MRPAIHVEGLGKQYVLGEAERYGALRDSLARMARRIVRGEKRERRIFWALRDIGFDVHEGEVFGVIGRNGSGKSTLLKILSRITAPTTGSAAIAGRVGSLLEVGTGFHPELTGRENVYVNGAILGISKRDIARRFDEIVAFADVERFIETPVKHYSSGMQMRLAFAVAAHFEPEILLVDEVLAVGDVAFQKKCLGKMEDVTKQGRTILFVSHQMNQLRRLCHRCVWLDSGKVVDVGAAGPLISRYESALMAPAADDDRRQRSGAHFTGWQIDDRDGDNRHILETSGPVSVTFSMDLYREVHNAHHGVVLYDQEGRVLWGTGTDNLDLTPGSYQFSYHFESLPVRPGPYQWLVTLMEGGAMIDSYFGIPNLLVATTPTGHRQDEWAGILNLDFTTSVTQTSAEIDVALAR